MEDAKVEETEPTLTAIRISKVTRYELSTIVNSVEAKFYKVNVKFKILNLYMGSKIE